MSDNVIRKKSSHSFSGPRSNEGGGGLAGALRLPPQSIEAEESVLGGILLDPNAINGAIELIHAEDFYRAGHQAIFRAMKDLTERREPIDVISVSQELRAKGALEDAGGIEYLSKLSAIVPSAANVGYYAKLVKQTALRRRLIHEATDIINEAFRDDIEVEDFLDSVEQRLFTVSEYRVAPSFYRVSDLVKESIKHVEKLYDKKELVTGVATGYPDFDKMTAGLQSGDLVILAARPSMGKTSLALCMAQYSAVHDGRGGRGFLARNVERTIGFTYAVFRSGSR
jgi:replicative DNA helicase